MSAPFKQVREWRNVDAAMFRDEIVPLDRPAVLKGLVADWPAVAAGEQSPEAICAYLRRFDAKRPVVTLIGEPDINGLFFYREDMSGLNFALHQESFADMLSRMLAQKDDPTARATATQAVPIEECMPGFESENSIAFLDPRAVPRLWIGNAITTQTHYDLADNIACVVAGRRRFTFFPPDQLPNLYVGPLDFTVSGPPTSMALLDAPDFQKYPRFRDALAVAEQCDLEPGDAVYVPYLWWHHVQSMDSVSVLINNWWREPERSSADPWETLLYAMMTIRDLEPKRRDQWRQIFDHYVFKTGIDPAAHLAPQHRGILGPLTAKMIYYIKTKVVDALNR